MSSSPDSIEMYAAALSPHPKRGWVVAIVFLVCVTISFLGACLVAIAHEAGQGYAAKACADSGGTWGHGSCDVPAINIQVVPRGRANEGPAASPLNGPGGA